MIDKNTLKISDEISRMEVLDHLALVERDLLNALVFESDPIEVHVKRGQVMFLQRLLAAIERGSKAKQEPDNVPIY